MESHSQSSDDESTNNLYEHLLCARTWECSREHRQFLLSRSLYSCNDADDGGGDNSSDDDSGDDGGDGANNNSDDVNVNGDNKIKR
jgi:hypothetical protein